MDIVIAFIIIGLLAYGLERNRRRQAQTGFGPAGTSDVIDRDTERLRADLQARS